MYPVVLSGERVRLREFTSADSDAFASQADYPSMFEYMKFRYSNREEALSRFGWLTHPDRFTEPRWLYYLVIESTAEPSFVGYAGAGGPEDAVEFGWYLTPPNWGHGFATEATTLLLDWGFGAMRWGRMVATCDPENLASRRVLEKAGLHLEGPTKDVKTWRGLRPRLLYSAAAGRQPPADARQGCS
jgi:[ribosomal protein S5]-alanine N-acetyltransferase